MTRRVLLCNGEVIASGEGLESVYVAPDERLVAERPILFSAPMVRALLAGTKTQTRRVVKLLGAEVVEEREHQTRRRPGVWSPEADDWVPCPYGVPGDRLWVRETWRTERRFDSVAPKAVPPESLIQHAEEEPEPSRGVYGKTRPSIYMPRWASRITLEVTGVRVERLQSISEEDAKAEGVDLPYIDREAPDWDWTLCSTCGGTGLFTDIRQETYGVLPDTDCTRCDTAAKRYRWLWESINGAESWVANPWVWVISFRRVTP